MKVLSLFDGISCGIAERLKELKLYREMIPSASEVFLDEIRSDKK